MSLSGGSHGKGRVESITTRVVQMPGYPSRKPSLRSHWLIGNAVRVNPDEERRTQRELVRSGYDAISMAYRDERGRANPSGSEDTTAYENWLDELAELLPDGASVLDLGCGAGVPASRILVDRGFNVTGLDISAVQIRACVRTRTSCQVRAGRYGHLGLRTRQLPGHCHPLRADSRPPR